MIDVSKVLNARQAILNAKVELVNVAKEYFFKHNDIYVDEVILTEKNLKELEYLKSLFIKIKHGDLILRLNFSYLYYAECPVFIYSIDSPELEFYNLNGGPTFYAENITKHKLHVKLRMATGEIIDKLIIIKILHKAYVENPKESTEKIDSTTGVYAVPCNLPYVLNVDEETFREESKKNVSTDNYERVKMQAEQIKSQIKNEE